MEPQPVPSPPAGTWPLHLKVLVTSLSRHKASLAALPLSGSPLPRQVICPCAWFLPWFQESNGLRDNLLQRWPSFKIMSPGWALQQQPGMAWDGFGQMALVWVCSALPWHPVWPLQLWDLDALPAPPSGSSALPADTGPPTSLQRCLGLSERCSSGAVSALARLCPRWSCCARAGWASSSLDGLW